MNILEPQLKDYTIYYKDGCPYSESAVSLMKERKLKYKLIKPDVSEFKKRFGDQSTFPRIYKGIELVGGYDQLVIKLK